jgi:beta-lactamase regulating signal transducer with metallopeptidase domain
MSSLLSATALTIAGALLDSLWEGVLIVAGVWCALRYFPKLGAATRYAVWLCALLALALVPALSVLPPLQLLPPVGAGATSSGVTGAREIQARTFGATVRPSAVAADSVPGKTATAPPPLQKTAIAVPALVAFAIALAWLVLAVGRGGFLFRDLIELATLRRRATLWSTANEFPVYVSEQTGVPLAVGFVRAAIILPAVLVHDLSAEEISAIIIHESAHIRRADVWTNALARVVESLLALSPATWFAMRELARQREIACDDWVVAQTGTGDAFARTLAMLACAPQKFAPRAAASVLGSRHAVVERIERLLESRQRLLRLSPRALGSAMLSLALVALILPAMSPVLAYAPNLANCSKPNSGIVLTYVYGPNRLAAGSPAANFEMQPASVWIAHFGAANVAKFELTVDAAGHPKKVVVLSAPPYPGIREHLTRLLMTSTYEPARRDCAPVAATIQSAVHFRAPEPRTFSVIAPVYAAGWSAADRTACKVPTVTHARYRSGFVAPTPYTAMMPAFPDDANDLAVDAKTTASARVRVSGAGEPTSVRLTRSSGRKAFDNALVSAAGHATYPLDATVCKVTPTEYVWTTEFARTVIP